MDPGRVNGDLPPADRSADDAFAAYHAAQQTILDRLDAFLAQPVDAADDLDRLDRRLAHDERQRLAAALATHKKVVAQRCVARAGGKRIHLKDYGAVGDGKADDGPALRAAVAALAGVGDHATLVIPAGTYRLEGFHDPRRRYALVLRGLKHVTLDAEPETTFIGTEIGGVLLLLDCHDVVISNVSVDLDPLPTTQGRIERVALACDEKLGVAAEGDMTGTDSDGRKMLSVVWALDPGHTPPDKPPFSLTTGRNANVYHVQSGEPLGGHGAFNVRRVEALGEGRFRLTGPAGAKAFTDTPPGEVPAAFAAGARLGMRTRGVAGARCAVWMDNCTDCDLQAVDVCASYHFAFLVSHTAGCSFRRCRVGVSSPAKSDRLCAVNADGFHCKSNRQGPLIEQCQVLNTPDDCGNLYSRCASAADQLDQRTLVLDTVWDDEDRYTGDFADGEPAADRWGWRPDRRAYAPGDLLLLIDPITGSPDLMARIESVWPHNWHGRRVVAITLEEPLPPSLRTRRSIGMDFPLQSDSHFLRHERDNPGAPIEHFTINLATKSDGFVIRDCHMGRNTVTAFKLNASNGIIEDNLFERHGWCCVSVLMELKWQEGFAPRNVLLRRNRFENRFGVNAGCQYLICTSPRPAYIRRLDIAENLFVHGEDGWSLRLDDCRHTTIVDNTFANATAIHVLPNGDGITTQGNHYPAGITPAPVFESGAAPEHSSLLL